MALVTTICCIIVPFVIYFVANEINRPTYVRSDNENHSHTYHE